MEKTPRILANPEVAAAFQVLTKRLSRPDLRLLLELATNEHVAEVTPLALIQQQQTDRFCEPSSGDAVALAQAAATSLVTATDSGFTAIQLSTLAPLGASPYFSYLSQSNVMTTAGMSEVATDPTNALALIGATRRRPMRDRAEVTRLSAAQRVTRRRQFDAPGALPHFAMLGLVSIGPDPGKRRFEVSEIRSQVAVLTAVVAAVNPRCEVRIEVSDNSGRRDQADALAASLSTLARTDLGPTQQDAARYHPDLSARVFASANDDFLEIGNTGATLFSNEFTGARERMVASRLGLDQVLDLTLRHRSRPATRW